MSCAESPLAWFRTGLAGVLLLQSLCLIGHLDELFGRHGIVAWSVTEAEVPGVVPSLAWTGALLRFLGMRQGYEVHLTFALYIGGLTGVLFRYQARLSAIVAWLAHTALMSSGPMSMYGVDRFAQIGLFYCVWFPIEERCSRDRQVASFPSDASFKKWLALRVLQTHVCIAYFASGVEKALGAQWRNGEAVWQAMMTTTDPLFDYSLIATTPGLAIGMCWATLVLEIGVIAFVWHPLTRKFWLIGIISMHAGIAALLGLWTFSATMIVFDVAAFGYHGLGRQPAACKEPRSWLPAASVGA